MKALILAAGFGTRLGDLTRTTPKALVKVGHAAILDHNIRKLLEVGISEILVNTHYFSEKIESFLADQHYRMFVSTIYEPELLGTAGTIKANWERFDGDDFLVMHGDNYFEDNLISLLSAHVHRTKGTVVTMATFDSDSPESCGTIITNRNEVVVKFFEKDRHSPSLRANAAIYVFSSATKSHFLGLPPLENDISNHVIPKLLGKIQAHYLLGDFIDIGTPTGLAKAELSYDRITKHI